MVLQRLLRSRKFWWAIFGIAQTVLFQYVPDFPRDVWLAIDALVGIAIAAIAVEDAAEKIHGYHQIQRTSDQDEDRV